MGGRGGRVVSAFAYESEHPGSNPPVASLVSANTNE